MGKVLIKIIIGVLFLICSSFFLEEALIGVWYSWIGLPLFDTVDSSLFFDLVSLGSLSLFICICLLSGHYIPKGMYIIFSVYALIYLEFRFLGSNTYSLVPFYMPGLNWAAYADIVPIAMAIYAISAKKNISIEEPPRPVTKTLYFEDRTDVEDILGHKDQAETIAAIIKTEYALSENSVGFAITGEWGAGKSTFLSYLNDSLKDCICINFDPWTERSTNVVSDLLDRIELGIKDKDIVLEKTFRRYVEKVNVTNVTGWFGLMVLAIRNFFDYETEDVRRSKLKAALKNQDKPIVVFIDDSDRLPDDLFLKTVSVIRGIGDFPNMVFIVAFDQQRANDKLKDFGGQDFMCKLFNVIHPLQHVDEDIIKSQLIENISSILTDGPHKTESCRAIVDKAFSGLSLKRYLPTLREMKRFCNIIEKDFCIIKDTEILHFIDIRQWLNIELLKFTDLSVYSMIAANPRVYLREETHFGLNSPYYVLKSDAVFSKKESKDLLSALFSPQTGLLKDTCLISNPCYFDLYFNCKFPENYVKSATIDKFTIFEGDSNETRLSKAEGLKEFIHANWSTRNATNIESAVSEILDTYPVDLLYPALEYIAKEYVATRKGTTLKEAGECDGYRKYANVIREHPYLSALSFDKLEELCKFDGHEAADDTCILKSQNPLIHCVIFNYQIRNWDHDGRMYSDDYLFDLLKKLASEGRHHDVVWAVSDCISADLQKKFLSEYLQDHLLDCLPYLLCHYKNPYKKENLIYANIPAIEGLFLSHDGFKKAMSKFKWNKSYDEDLLKELCRLVDLSNYIEIHDEWFKVELFPLLNAYLDGSQTLLSKSHIKSDSFWTDGDRIEEVFEYSFV